MVEGLTLVPGCRQQQLIRPFSIVILVRFVHRTIVYAPFYSVNLVRFDALDHRHERTPDRVNAACSPPVFELRNRAPPTLPTHCY